MPPKKGFKRKAETVAGRGEKKQLIEGYESGSEDFNVPKGFAEISLREWIENESKTTPRSGALRPAVRVIRGLGDTVEGLQMPTHYAMDQLSDPILKTEETDSRTLGEPAHELANTECNKRQASLKLRRSTRLGSLIHSSGKYCEQDITISSYFEKGEDSISQISSKDNSVNADSASNNQQAFFDNSNNKEQVNVPLQPNTEDQGRAHSITLTEMARADDCNPDEDEVECPALVTVAGCRVKIEFANTARIIEKNHGDVLAGSSFEGTLRSNLFENLCTIYQKLEKVKFTVITVADLELMKKDVSDLLKANVDVGWLAKRLEEIHHAKGILLDVPNMKKVRNKKQERILELEMKVKKLHSEFQEVEKELESEKEAAAEIRQMHILAKDEVKRFYEKSLVEGI